MNASTIKSNLRNRLIAIAVAIALIAGAVMAYPVFSDDPSNASLDTHHPMQIADPQYGDGGGTGGG